MCQRGHDEPTQPTTPTPPPHTVLSHMNLSVCPQLRKRVLKVCVKRQYSPFGCTIELLMFTA